MGKNMILTLILVFLIVANVSDAAILGNFRKLVSTEEHTNATGSPVPSPVLPGKQSSPVVDKEKGKEKQDQPTPPSTHGEESSKDKEVKKNVNVTLVTPPTDGKEQNNTSKEDVKEKVKEKEDQEEEKEKKNEKAEGDGEQKEEEKEKENEKAEEKDEQKEKEKEDEKAKKEDEQKEKENEKAKKEDEQIEKEPVGSDESCDGMERRCRDLKSMVACIKSFDHDSKALVLLIQNKGDSSLKVDLPAAFSGNKQKLMNIPKLQSKQVDLKLADDGNNGINEITLNAGNGHCVLHLGTPVSQGNFFQRIPSYSKFMTPIYGAYLILLITFLAGGVWACCWFSKRKGQSNIPYQELEMSMPESAAAVETAEGWDEVWDDDWDEENAVRSPGGHRISANGLTSRNSKKDDWEDWDD
ncbi:uncharacterized protein LOC104898153 [Beta vulgaris subsp. vulgaris]|uniref:uncharacterized protein LOC104898153 n=1 Tax=Beta vulgaris subsp. vulgaris TaxID=3555 RepID=UPI0020368DD6|nr:uncharacterized protein LOC104898153 [Beta vulgaris subsp. vulgaris]